jgi:glutamyl-tRNA synthetase
MTVRVRFAPSPTGYLHIGNARTALINYLFAKKQDGVFIFRLDDTDQERSSQQFADAIVQDLAWLGLSYEESFKQSDRFERYREAVQQLINAGRLYPCYETQEELDFKRKRLLSKGLPPIYDRGSLNLSQEQKDAFEKEGRRPHWRFLLKSDPITWHDLIRGDVHFEGERLSDPVLVREDGAFLYTLTSVVDDVDTQITHILRGEDHVTNTAVQIQLFQALGRQQPPVFGHTTLLLDEEGNSLSKRIGSLSLQELQRQGLDPMAINSLLARLGTSLPIEPFSTMDELISLFDLSTFSRTPPKFSPQDLMTLNHKLLQIFPFYEVIHRTSLLGIADFSIDFWEAIKGNLTVIQDIREWYNVCYGDFVTSHDDPEYLAAAFTLIPSEPWSTQTWDQWIALIKERTGRKGKDLFMPLRHALTGRDSGPEMKKLLPLIGYQRTQNRLLG